MAAGGNCGPVTFNVANGTYTEQVSIPAIIGASAVNRVVFQSASGDSSTVNLTYSSTVSTANYTLLINGASYVTFKKMTISATNATYGTVIAIAGTPASDSIAKCRLNGFATSSNTTNHCLIYLNGTVPVGFTIYNNAFNNSSYGIYWYGNNSSAHTEGTTVLSNLFTNQYAYGWNSQYADGLYFNKNIITTNSTYTSFYGVYCYLTFMSTRTPQLVGNKITSTTSGYGAYMYYFPYSGSGGLIAGDGCG